ncbi:5-methyltetrahydropteroyltriglutamate--homocysteine methyltransferase [Galdieria sulphuraria]|nr:5-methyltetrahydropteroyltriglutamate--homocysteine methyltransferase [Galdieria sulphuraria]
MVNKATATIGYPRIGLNREMKKALEAYWGEESLKDQMNAGIQLIGVGDHTMYDHVLDWTFRLGLIPDRFKQVQNPKDKYFAMARGNKEGLQALDMSKFFDSNYHYLVPELNAHSKPSPSFEEFLDEISRAQQQIGKERAVPIVFGPVTYARLARCEGVSVDEMISRLVPAYVSLLNSLKSLQVPEVQLHEPGFVLGDAETLQKAAEAAYQELAKVQVPINLVTYYDDLGKTYPWVVKLPVQTISMDFVRGDNLSLVKKHGFPADKKLGAGVLDGRSVWKDTGYAAQVIKELEAIVKSAIVVQPSCSLMHVPLDVNSEPSLDSSLKSRLSFARQKIAELGVVASGKSDGASSGSSGATSQDLEATLDKSMFSRCEPFSKRRSQQFTVPGGFGTTTIGSFPQTPAVRKLRLQYKKGQVSEEEYQRQIDRHISFAIGVQEALGLDVFVHGESERSDMVEYFGQKLRGFTFTENGWVQSYGSRYVRPPIIYADVSRISPMTVREFVVAQSMTNKPVKGMLTGPVTILNWSFPRKDIPRKQQALQIALALRDEVADLEKAGCAIIQMDEPALREGLPLKKERWNEYLDWAVKSFRLSTVVAAPKTQIVTHLCYSDFQDILEAIDQMDADVLTIENSRSDDAMLRALAQYGYARDIGPGVYDVHSPAVPSTEFLVKKMEGFKKSGILLERLWINPDCGLKTRQWEEVIPSLRNMVDVAVQLRKTTKNGI